MRRVILFAAFFAACGEGQGELLDPPPIASLTPSLAGTWTAGLSGDGLLTSDTTFTATVSASAEFRVVQSSDSLSGEYTVDGTINTLDPDGAALSFPLMATGRVDGQIAMVDPGDPPMPMVPMWGVTATLASFSGGADAGFAATVFDLFPTTLPVDIRFTIGGLVHESRTYQFEVTGTADKQQ